MSYRCNNGTYNMSTSRTVTISLLNECLVRSYSSSFPEENCQAVIFIDIEIIRKEWNNSERLLSKIFYLSSCEGDHTLGLN